MAGLLLQRQGILVDRHRVAAAHSRINSSIVHKRQPLSSPSPQLSTGPLGPPHIRRQEAPSPGSSRGSSTVCQAAGASGWSYIRAALTGDRSVHARVERLPGAKKRPPILTTWCLVNACRCWQRGERLDQVHWSRSAVHRLVWLQHRLQHVRILTSGGVGGMALASGGQHQCTLHSPFHPPNTSFRYNKQLLKLFPFPLTLTDIQVRQGRGSARPRSRKLKLLRRTPRACLVWRLWSSQQHILACEHSSKGICTASHARRCCMRSTSCRAHVLVLLALASLCRLPTAITAPQLNYRTPTSLRRPAVT